jgi:hypothetical protein
MVAHRVVVLIVGEGHDVAGGAVPVGKDGPVVLNRPPVLGATDEAVFDGVGKGPYGRVWMIGGRLVALWVLVLSVPDRGLLLLENEPEEEGVLVGTGRVTFVGGEVPVETGSEELYVGMEALGADESGGKGTEPVPTGPVESGG